MINKKLKNAIVVFEKSIQSNNGVPDTLSEKRIIQMMGEKMCIIERTYDDKLKTFTEAIQKSHRDEMKETKKGLNNKIAEMHENYVNLKVAYDRETNALLDKIHYLKENTTLHKEANEKIRVIASFRFDRRERQGYASKYETTEH